MLSSYSDDNSFENQHTSQADFEVSLKVHRTSDHKLTHIIDKTFNFDSSDDEDDSFDTYVDGESER